MYYFRNLVLISVSMALRAKQIFDENFSKLMPKPGIKPNFTGNIYIP